MAFRLHWGLSALLLALLVSSPPSWGRSESTEGDFSMKPVYRFVDPDMRPNVERQDGRGPSPEGSARSDGGRGVGTTGYSRATIRDDARFVLAAPPRGSVVRLKGITAAPDGHLRLISALDARFAEARQIVAIPRIKVGDSWTTLPGQVVKPERIPRGHILRLDFKVPAEKAAEINEVRVEGYGVNLAKLSPLRTPAVHIPEGARLEFSLGILEPAWDQGRVDFRLLSCESSQCSPLFSETIDPSSKGQQGWQERRVSLDGLAGKTRSFLFEAKPILKEGGFSFPVWGNPTIYAPAPRAADDVNVILLSIDTLRARSLTTYGCRHDTAPFIEERFGKGGTVFEDCVASATSTTPSHMSMFTSLQPAAHGVKSGLEALSPTITTLPELLRAADIETAAVTEDGWLGIQYGFGRGFNTYAENKSADIMVPAGQVDLTFGKAKGWLSWNRDKRFFLFLHTFQVHEPYWPPPRYKHLFTDFEGGKIDANSPAHLRAMANYEREIRYTDDELRSLFVTIDSLGLAKNTVFILASDHGEEFLEHGQLGHGANLYEEAVHVPLMFWGKGVPAGKRIEKPVSHVDFMPTILDLFGIPSPDYARGVSLMPLLEGASAPTRVAERALFSESHSPIAREKDKIVPFLRPAYAVRKGHRKLSRYRTGKGYRYELYDLSTDPQEKHNLYPSRAHDAADLRILIDNYEKRCAQRRAKIESALTRTPASTVPEKPLLDPAQEEKLRALGYIE
jgi:arylsulfatase A-like enzyme